MFIRLAERRNAANTNHRLYLEVVVSAVLAHFACHAAPSDRASVRAERGAI